MDFILIAREIKKDASISQRSLSEKTKLSLGLVNKLIKESIEKELLIRKDKNLYLSEKGKEVLENKKVERAVILAAGFGQRFVPLTFDMPKGLLKVFDEPMLERQIKQLHEKGIEDIIIVVGYLKEKFEYLIDKYKVKLVYNKEYAIKNTLASLYTVREFLKGKNTYILSSDNWIGENIYNEYEAFSWYSSIYKAGKTREWALKFNKKSLITDIKIGSIDSYVMYGPVYLEAEFSNTFMKLIEEYYEKEGTDDFYWENVLIEAIKDKKYKELKIYINKQEATNVYEFENLEELREFDKSYNDNSDNEALQIISKVFDVKEKDILNLTALKKGMTNKSFLFSINDKRYICRVPGKGTSSLIDRKAEYLSYEAIKNFNLSEEIIYFDKEKGYKISVYYENSRNANFENEEDILSCIKVLKDFHQNKIKVSHHFDLKERIEFYTKLCEESGGNSFLDNEETRNKMLELYEILESLQREKSLAHIDSVSDNFLFTEEGIKLIDWEYSGMADSLIDLAMLAIYSYFDKEKVDFLIDNYLKEEKTKEDSFVVYAYIALGGYLWSLWAVYKSNLLEEFGEYTIKMYRYAKEYYKFAKEILEES